MTDQYLMKEIHNGAALLREFREREPLVTGDDTQMLAPHKMKELQVLIRKGAKDMEQDWTTPEHLLNKAFKVAGHRIPSPDMTDGWEQYEYLIGFTVGVLGNTRGPNAKWRRTEPKKFNPDEDAIENVLNQMPGYKDINEFPGIKK